MLQISQQPVQPENCGIIFLLLLFEVVVPLFLLCILQFFSFEGFVVSLV